MPDWRRGAAALSRVLSCAFCGALSCSLLSALPIALPNALATALSFLTRLGQPRMVDEATLARSVAFYMPVGLLVGVLTTLPLWLLYLTGAQQTWVLALGYVLLQVWITRGLHMDGLADVGDAWGSGAQGERFWQVLRDSRLGAFGAVFLFLGLIALLLGAQLRLDALDWSALVLAPAFGRGMAVLLAFLAPPYEPHSLGGKACAGATGTLALAVSLLLLLCVTALAWADALLTLVGAVALLWALRSLALRQGGSSGDFLGTAIVGGEVLFLLTVY